MTVVVSFIRPKVSGSASGVGLVRKRVDLTVPGTTTETVQDGEFVVIGNGEANMIAVAFGASGPDAAVSGVAVPSGGISYPLFPKTGDVINVKVVT